MKKAFDVYDDLVIVYYAEIDTMPLPAMRALEFFLGYFREQLASGTISDTSLSNYIKDY